MPSRYSPSSTDVYYRTTYPLYYYTDTSFRIITVGADLKFGIPFSEADTLYFGLGIEQNRLRTDSSTPQSYKDYVAEFGNVVNNVPITTGWARDNRDSSLVPSRGYYVQANGEVGTPVGGTEYYKADVQTQYYYSFARGFILGLNLQGGYGNGLGGKAYPIFKIYYAGGIGSVRGYESSSLGPTDKTTGDPIGGSRMVVANVEMTFPLPGSGWDRTLRVFTFLDAGNVWGNEGNSTGANGLRYSYGAGLEWISPIGPLKLSLGFPVVKHATDKYQKFQFQIGTSFSTSAAGACGSHRNSSSPRKRSNECITRLALKACFQNRSFKAPTTNRLWGNTIAPRPQFGRQVCARPRRMNSDSVGTPSADARCPSPESLPMKKPDSAIHAATSTSLSNECRYGAVSPSLSHAGFSSGATRNVGSKPRRTSFLASAANFARGQIF
ncbi:surface antigen (D15) [Burkholderia sp. H160]|nr:surface antigen (D15) [Burkholderia sp. H160]